jgi:ABC-type cobalt transport system substrate-binding protein
MMSMMISLMIMTILVMRMIMMIFYKKDEYADGGDGTDYNFSYV